MIIDPGWMANLKRVANLNIQRLTKIAENLLVKGKTSRQLEEYDAQFFSKTGSDSVKTTQEVGGIFKPFTVGDEFAAFYTPKEIVRRSCFPVFKCRLIGEPIEGGIEFNGVEMFDVVFQPFCLGPFVRIKNPLPVHIGPSRRANPYRNALCHSSILLRSDGKVKSGRPTRCLSQELS